MHDLVSTEWLAGALGTPMAVRTNPSTITMRVKEVINRMSEGATLNRVITTTICMPTLAEPAWPAPPSKSTAKRHGVAAPAAGAAASWADTPAGMRRSSPRAHPAAIFNTPGASPRHRVRPGIPLSFVGVIEIIVGIERGKQLDTASGDTQEETAAIAGGHHQKLTVTQRAGVLDLNGPPAPDRTRPEAAPEPHPPCGQAHQEHKHPSRRGAGGGLRGKPLGGRTARGIEHRVA
jgi:hypothetical protein